MKKLSAIMVALLILSIGAAIGVTVWVNKVSQPISGSSPESGTTADTQAWHFPDESSSAVEPSTTAKKAQQNTTVKEEISMLSLNYETTAPFKAKKAKRKFNGQSDRFKLYKTIFEENFNAKDTDVFFYDITHDDLADMIVLTPLVDESTKKTVGKVIQLFTITKENTVTEIFRDYGGISVSGNGISCYVTEIEGEDCLLIVKDMLNDSIGKLTFSACYVLNDGTVVTKSTAQYTTDESMAYENEKALNRYSESLEKELTAAHTCLFDYRYPKAVSSKAEAAFDEYL